MRAALQYAAPAPVASATRPTIQRKIRIGPVDDPLEREADRVANQVVNSSDPAISAVSTPPRISRKCEACEEEDKLQRKEAGAQVPGPGMPARVSLRTAPKIMRLSQERFRRRLGRTDDQKKVIDALFDNTEFMSYWNWLDACGGRGALGPVKLRVRRTWDNGVERFGVFKHDSRTLIVNPWMPEAIANPLELVDSVVHELLHAIHWAHVNGKCPDKLPPVKAIEYTRREKPGRKGKNDDGTKPPDLMDVKGSTNEIDLLERQGPSASDPCGSFIDILETPQSAINEVVSDVGERTGIGGSTRTKANEILRNDIRKARERGARFYSQFIEMAPVLAEFIRCRDEACFKKPCELPQPGTECPRRPRRERDRDIEVCFQDVLQAESAGTIQRMATEDAEGDELQQTPARSDSPAHAASALAQGGVPLTREERAYFEPRFGRDFSAVRVHTDRPAAEAARGINARAYTLGRDIAFANGEYRPGSQEGKRLIAHELAHVVHQTDTPRPQATLRRQPAEKSRSKPAFPSSVKFVGCDQPPYSLDYVRTSAINAFTETSGDCIRNEALRRDILAAYEGLTIVCNPDTKTGTCGETDKWARRVNLFKQSLNGTYCPGELAATIFHEVVHVAQPGNPFHGDLAYDCGEACYPGADELKRGDASKCDYERGWLPFVGASLGTAIPGKGGPATGYARLYLGIEKRGPVLGIFRPSLGIGVSVIGVPLPGQGADPAPGTSTFLSLMAALRFDPGKEGGAYLSLAGGPEIAFSSDKSHRGYQLGARLGYRWHIYDVSLGAGTEYDPTRNAGEERFYTLGATFQIAPKVR